MTANPPHNEKFLFDVNNFDGSSNFDPDDPTAAIYSENDLEAARKAAFAEGHAKGLADGQASRDQQIVALTEKLSTQIKTLINAERAREARFEQELITLARTIATQSFPILNEHFGLPQIVDTIAKILGGLGEGSVVVVEVAPLDQEELVARLRPLLARHPGDVTIMAQSDLEAGNFRLKWQDGGAIRDTNKLAQQLIDALGRALAEDAQKAQDQPGNH